MIAFTYCMFSALLLICCVLQLISYRLNKNESIGNNPQFLKFQRGYFFVYLAAMFADWLQGPYLYKLYSYYGFQEEQIAILYVFGFASTVILGTWTPMAADKFGRKKLCLMFTILYSVSCVLKLSRSYGILLIGRLLGGIATSVLFSAFEAWYVHEHLETHDFPSEWISVTFSKASTLNGVLAVVAGATSNLFAETFNFGPVAPYMMAIPFLVLVGIIISSNWSENYSVHKIKFRLLCYEGLKNIVQDEKMFMIGAIEALFESVIYIVIFLWTPILSVGNPPLGIVFSCFMLCVLTGSALFHIFSLRRVNVPVLLIASTVIALISTVMCVISTHPNRRDSQFSFVALLLFEFAVGIYFPAMGYLRTHIIPEANRWSITNWFRVPINLIACVMLLLLHEDVFRNGNRMIFVICSVLLLFAVLAGVRFVRIAKDDDSLKQEVAYMESEHIHNIF